MIVEQTNLKLSSRSMITNLSDWQNICYFRSMETLIIQPKTKEQLIALKAFMKALKIEYKSEKGYDPEFVEEVLKSREDIKKGKGVKIATEDLWK